MLTGPPSSAGFSDAFFERSPVPMWVAALDTLRFLAVNDAAIAFYGYSREEFLALTLLDIRPAAEHERFLARLATLEGGTDVHASGGIWIHRRRDGREVQVEVRYAHGVSYEGQRALLVMVFDVTDRNTHMKHLRAYQTALHDAQDLGNLGTFILDLDEGVYRLAGMTARAFGRTEAPIAEAAAEVRRVFYNDPQEGERLIEALESLTPYDGEFRMDVNGETRWFTGRTSIIRDADGRPTGMIGISCDINDRKLESERLRAIAFTDSVTGLPNRAALLDQANAQPAFGALVLVRLGAVADTSGRLQRIRIEGARQVADTLRKLMPAGSTLLRYNDHDTFGIAIESSERMRRPKALAQRIIAAFERPVRIGEDEFVVNPSVGVGVADGAQASFAELALRAEAALHQAERSDGRIATYTSELARAHDRRAIIERNLRHAILEKRVGVAYQPIVSLGSGRITGAEALMRWDCPGIGAVPPEEFIAIAEESGVILRLGEWILREACAQNRRWQVEGLPAIRIAVNVSARQVQQREFLRLVSSICESTGLSPSHLELELTERVMMHRDGLALRNLIALRRLGAHVSVDDFGTGYSALSYLTELPLDTLKLDRAFVAPIDDDPFQREIAESLVRLAHRRGLTTVGEAVETVGQLDRLRAMGCDEAQGFLLGRPMSADDFAALLGAASP